jgi:hypothetical protein
VRALAARFPTTCSESAVHAWNIERAFLLCAAASREAPCTRDEAGYTADAGSRQRSHPEPPRLRGRTHVEALDDVRKLPLGRATSAAAWSPRIAVYGFTFTPPRLSIGTKVGLYESASAHVFNGFIFGAHT